MVDHPVFHYGRSSRSFTVIGVDELKCRGFFVMDEVKQQKQYGHEPHE
jgi:hypothetical protein